jgi:sugar transferase (PEP-CTERM/EpsH1 system associated)
MIRVAHVVYSFDTGGLEHGIVKLLNALPQDRYQHTLISLTDVGPLAEKIRAPGTRFIGLGKRAGNDPGLVYRLGTTLREARPHVLRTYAWPTWLEGMIAARIAGIRAHVHSEHGLYFYASPAQHARRKRAQPIFTAFTDAVVAVSADIASALRATGVPQRKVHVIRNGVDTDAFKPGTPAERAEIRASLGLGPHTLAIGSVGRLVKEKDYASLARAVAALGRDRELALVIAGEGPEREKIQAAARESGLGDRLRLLGKRDDVARLYRALDIFVLSSISEGLSNTLLEASASGLPIVATRVGGNAEVVAEGESGLIVPASDVDQLSGALRRIVGDAALAAKLAAGGRLRILKQFSIRSMAEGHGVLLEKYARLRAGYAQAA